MLVKFQSFENAGMVDALQQDVLVRRGLVSRAAAEFSRLSGIGIEAHAPPHLREGDVGRFPVLIDIAFHHETRQGIIANPVGTLRGADAGLVNGPTDGL
jgi:hypothetical protein